MSREFSTFTEQFKVYNEEAPYKEMNEVSISFDSEKDLTPLSMIDSEQIVHQLSEISKKQFFYTSLYESQKRVLQTVEDEYEMWYAQTYSVVDSETELIVDNKGNQVRVPIKRNETQKEMTIKTRFAEEYTGYRELIKNETYKLGLIAGVKKSLDSFSYKLNNINEYAKTLD